MLFDKCEGDLGDHGTHFSGFLVLDFFPNVKKPGLRMVYLKMVTGAPVWSAYVLSNLKKRSSVWLIKYVWFNIFWLFGPKYVLIPTYGLFETEE